MSENQKQGKRPWYRRRKKPVGKTEPLKPKGNFAFIDSQNLNLGVQKIGWKMDWHKFREWLRTEYNVTQAYMFIGYLPENESLYEQMYNHGFLVVLKPTLEIRQVKAEVPTTEKGDKFRIKATGMVQNKPGEKQAPKTGAEEKPATKGNIDADLVLYAMKELQNYDKAVLVSGDGDFFSLVEYLTKQNKLLKLLVPNRRFSTLLQDFEPYIEGIDQHRRELAYKDFRKRK